MTTVVARGPAAAATRTGPRSGQAGQARADASDR
jgi:hypothetical protein